MTEYLERDDGSLMPVGQHLTPARRFIEAQAQLARERGQGRFIPQTIRQARMAEAGAAALDAAWPLDVQWGDALIGKDPYWRAAYEMRYHQRLGEAAARVRARHEREHQDLVDDRCPYCGGV